MRPTKQHQMSDDALDALVPAVDGLTDKQAAFVDAYVMNGGRTQDAAIEAGYAEDGARQAGNRLLKLPHIQQALTRETLRVLGMSAPQALHTIRRLSNDARSEYVKLQAAQDLLDRAGFKPPERVDHRIDASLSVHLDILPDPKQVIDGEGG